jgi:hypothetical protein
MVISHQPNPRFAQETIDEDPLFLGWTLQLLDGPNDRIDLAAKLGTQPRKLGA